MEDEKKFYSVHWFENFQAAILWDDGTWERIDLPVIPGYKEIMKFRYCRRKPRSYVMEHIKKVLEENKEKNALKES